MDLSLLPPWSPAWIRRHHRALLVGALGLLFVWQWAITLGQPRDLGVYLTAGARALRGEAIYVASDDPGAAYKYSPVVALLFGPLSLLPFPLAQTAWFAFNFGLTLILPALAYRAVVHPRDVAASTSSHRFGVYALALALTLRYVLLNATAGQVAALQLALVLGGLVLAERDRVWSGGGLLGLAILLKIVPVLLLGLLLLRRRWRAVGAAALATAAWALVPALRYGLGRDLQLHLEWLRFVQAENILSQMTRPQNQSLLALVTRLLVPTPYGLNLLTLRFEQVAPWYGPIVLGGFVLALAGLWAWTRGASEELRDARLRVALPCLLAYLMVIGPHAWRFNYLGNLVAWVYAADQLLRGHRTSRTLPLAILSVAMVSLTTRDVSRSLETWTHLLGIEIWAACLALLACLDLLRSAALRPKAAGPEAGGRAAEVVEQRRPAAAGPASR